MDNNDYLNKVHEIKLRELELDYQEKEQKIEQVYTQQEQALNKQFKGLSSVAAFLEKFILDVVLVFAGGNILSILNQPLAYEAMRFTLGLNSAIILFSIIILLIIHNRDRRSQAIFQAKSQELIKNKNLKINELTKDHNQKIKQQDQNLLTQFEETNSSVDLGRLGEDLDEEKDDPPPEPNEDNSEGEDS